MIRAFIELEEWLQTYNLKEGTRVIIESPNAEHIIAQLKMEAFMIYDPKYDKQAKNAGQIMGIPLEIRKVES